MREIIGGLLVVFGLMIVAGSAGDCDGKCMEYANSIGDMLKIIAIGFFMMIVGGIILIKNS